MLIFAHRGASADAPENTLLAITEALAQQADGIEIDVYQVERSLIVIHDKWLHRTTNGHGQISDFTLSELRQLDAGKGEKIPTLDEVLDLVAGKTRINIEVKGLTNIDLLLEVYVKAMNDWNFSREQIIISSFDHHLLKNLKSLEPDMLIGALTANNPIDYALFAENLGAYSVNADVSFLDQAFVNDAHQRGLKVYAYTVDQPADLKTLFNWGLDGVFCNAPALAKTYINSLQSE